MSRAHRARRDTSEPEVIEALEVCGWGVLKLAQRGVPDLAVWRKHQRYAENGKIVGVIVRFVECKTKRGKLREGTQTKWEDDGLPVSILRSAEDVLAWHRQQTGDRT